MVEGRDREKYNDILCLLFKMNLYISVAFIFKI